MRRFAFAAFLAASFWPCVATAEDFNTTITSGKRTLVGQFAVYNSYECTVAEVPEGRLSRQPQHGKIEFVMERRSIKTDRCGILQFYVRSVYYTPNRGFRGTDEASADYQFFAYNEGHEITSRRQNYYITVK